MDQNSWQRGNMTDIDYLNEISSKPPSRLSFGGLNPKIVIIGGIFLFIIILMSVAVIVLSNNSDPASNTLAAKISGLETILKYSEDNRDSFDSSIADLVSEIRITTASDKNQLTSSINLPSKIDKKSLAAENTTAVIDELDSAKSTGRMSDEYIEALQIKIDEIISLLEANLQEVKKTSTKESLRNVILDYKELSGRLKALQSR